jgi:hypothetical protein
MVEQYRADQEFFFKTARQPRSIRVVIPSIRRAGFVDDVYPKTHSS